MKKILPILLLGLVAAASLPAYATPTPISTTINLNTVFAGNTPDGSAPWLVATFTSTTGSNSGTLTLTSNLSDFDFLQGLESSNAAVGWAFYLNTGISTILCHEATNCADNVLSGGGYNGGPTGKNWNLAFGWPVGSRFVSGDTAVYDITFASNLTDSPFVANPGDKHGQGAGWLSVAHVQGITGGCSGWIVAGNGTGANGDGPCTETPPTNVPEPSVLGVFGQPALPASRCTMARASSRLVAAIPSWT